MNEPLRCEAHKAVAGWQCTVCHQALCPDCAAYKYVPPAKLTVCALCGELAEPLLRQRIEKETLGAQLPEAFLFPIRGDGPALWLGLTMFFWLASYAGGGALLAAWTLSLGTWFAVIRGTASGHDALELADFREPVASMFLPAARFGIAMLPAWGGLLLAVVTGKSSWAWVALLLTLVWAPVNLIAAAHNAELLAMLDPRRVFSAAMRIGGDYLTYLGGLFATGVMWFLALTLGGALDHVLHIPFITPFVMQALLVYPVLIAARVAGLVLRRHPDAFGAEEHDRYEEVLGPVEPRGAPPQRQTTLPAHLPSHIELPPEEVPQVQASHRFAAMEVSAHAEAPPAVAPLDVRLLPGLGEQSARELRVAMRAGNTDAALDVFRATGLSCIELLTIDELLWLGQTAGARIDYESALLALEHAAKRDAAPDARGKAWVMLARLLGEKLERKDEATVWMQRVVSELPGSSAAVFAEKWLGK